jgi:hypothetical protein
MTVEKLIEDLRTEWQKLGFHPNVTVTFTKHADEVKASVSHLALPTIVVPTLPSNSDG